LGKKKIPCAKEFFNQAAVAQKQWLRTNPESFKGGLRLKCLMLSVINACTDSLER